MQPEDRLALYKNAIRKMKDGDFLISFPASTTDSHLRDFENELLELSAWIDQRFREINKLHEISTEISNGSLLSDVIDRIYHAFQDLIPYDRIGCALISDDGNEVITHWVKTNYQENIQLPRGFTAPLIDSSLDLIAQTKQPRILNDLEEYLGDHPKSNSTRLMIAEGTQSSLTCPLVANGKTIGFIFFSSLEKNTYRDIHQKIFVYIAQQVSLLIERSRLYQQVYELNHSLADAMALLREQACRDVLTGVYHRGTIMEFLGKNLHAGVRKKTPVSVIMVDVDNFKAINDIYGHIVSDAVLQQVAKTIVHHLRKYDNVGRYDRKEFLIVLDDTDATGAMIVAERIRRAISKLKLGSVDESFSVTVSMGISTADNVTSIKKEESLLSEADKALYQAREKGKNQVVIA